MRLSLGDLQKTVPAAGPAGWRGVGRKARGDGRKNGEEVPAPGLLSGTPASLAISLLPGSGGPERRGAYSRVPAAGLVARKVRAPRRRAGRTGSAAPRRGLCE